MKAILKSLALRLPWALLVLLAAGFVNVLVAWSASVLSGDPPTTNPVSGEASIHWPNPTPRVRIAGASAAACDWYDVYIDASVAERQPFLPAIWAESVPLTRFDGVGFRAGWPFRSLCASSPDDSLNPGSPRTVMLEAAVIVGAWRVPWGTLGKGVHDRLLPWNVLWPGTIANILFYSMLVCCFVVAPLYLRRRARRLRWACLRCGYPLGRQDVCTECGAPVVV